MKKALGLIIFATLIFFGFKGAKLFLSERTLCFEGEKVLKISENGFIYSAKAQAKTVGELLDEQKIQLGSQDRVYPQLDSKMIPGVIVAIQRAVPVAILVDGKTLDHYTFQASVEEALVEAGVSLSHLDRVQPDWDRGIEPNLEIIVTRINIEQVTEEKRIDFKTVEKEDDELRWRKKKVEQEGEKGIEEVVYEVTYKNGKQVSKEKISSKIGKQPVDEIVRIGTKVEVGKSKIGIASWYAYTGTMACASRMFPKGTWLRVTSQENGKQVFVVVNDYGPQRGTGKMIDLDSVAFKKLAPLGKGVVEVKVEEILE